MRAFARILAVLVAALVFSAVLLMVVAVIDVRRVDLDLDGPDAGSALLDALTQGVLSLMSWRCLVRPCAGFRRAHRPTASLTMRSWCSPVALTRRVI